jgi:hypothetical protein
MTPTHILTILSIGAVAYGINVFAEAWALNKFSKLENFSRCISIAAIANAISFPALLGAKYLLNHWDYMLPWNPFGWKVEAIFIWAVATMVANTIELMVVTWVFKANLTRGLLVVTAIANGLTALGDLSETMKWIKH